VFLETLRLRNFSFSKNRSMYCREKSYLYHRDSFPQKHHMLFPTDKAYRGYFRYGRRLR